jgi:hypothetical protein
MSGARRGAFVLALGLAAWPAVASAGGGHHGHHHHHGSRVVIGVGPYWGWGAPWWYGPRYYYPYPYPAYGYPVYPAPVYAPRVVVEEPPIYVERDPAPASAGWWYYCEPSGAYYPDVESCAEPWVKVPPRSE